MRLITEIEVNKMLITTINLHDFRCAFADYDRASQFSYEGLDALYRWLSILERP